MPPTKLPVVLLLLSGAIAGAASCGAPERPRASAPPVATTRPSASIVVAPAAPSVAAGPRARVRQIAAGGDVSCASFEDGTLACWGNDLFHVIGTGDRENPRPIRIQAPSAITAVSVGDSHACVRHVDATMSCWGSNHSGQLGLGSPATATGPGFARPTPVPGVGDVAAISLKSHSAALLADKRVMFWGDWDSGAGDPRPAGSARPALVAGLRDVVEVADGRLSACARLASGSVRCWNMVSPGRIPRGKDRVDPVAAPVKDAVRVFAADGGMCALTKAKKLVCWLDLTQQVMPWHPELAKLADVAELAFGGSRACARLTSGDVVCEQDGSAKPVAPLSGVTQIVAGDGHVCVLAHGDVLCWGSNTYGQLGDGTTTDRASPVRVAF